MLVLALTVLGMIVGAVALSEALWEHTGAERPDGPLERLASAATVAIVLMLVASWMLATVHVLTRPILAGVGLAAGIGGGAWLYQHRRKEWTSAGVIPFGTTVVLLVAFAPLVLWLAFIGYRGWLIGPCSHDAVAYHLPRAALIARSHGYEFFDATSMTISAYPANFEMLIADVIVLSGSDRVTEWVSTASYVYVLVCGGALAERFWGRGAHVAPVVMLTALVPIALIHSGAHKNDLLMSGAILSSLLWAARWSIRGGLAPFLMAWASVSLAIGTKISGPFLVGGLVPLIAYRAVTCWSARPWLPPGRRGLVLLSVVVLSFFLGATVYLVNLKAIGSPFPVHNDFGFDEGYGDWANLWRVPYLLFTRPFSAQDWGVWVPWRGEYWFWPRYDVYFGTLGAAASLTLFALPLGIWRYARDDDPARRRERIAVTLAAFVTVAATMPIRSRPLGFFGMFTRYLTYVPPILAAWTVAPAVRELSTRYRVGSRIVSGVLFALAGWFVFEAERCARKDSFVPLAWVAEVVDRPELEREIPVRPQNAASAVDRVAGPHDVIAFDGELDAWVYPAFGRDLTREVIPLHVRPGVHVEIPPRARWVAIDRNWNRIWNHDGFRDMGQARSMLFKGTPKPIDLQLFEQLSHDERFRLVFRYPPLEQYVFERVAD